MEQKTIKHRFLNHQINPATEILIVGTFNPDITSNEATFFYGRSHNFLWQLIPTAYGEGSLKGKSKGEKVTFIENKKIDFIDLISEVEGVEIEAEKYKDGDLDKRVLKWREVINEIKKLKCLRKICFTRKTFSDIPEMKKRIEEIQKYCIANNILFKCLTTPARPPKYYGSQDDWSNFFKNDN